MRRIFNNSTAIAVGVALMLPQAGVAQAAITPVPDAKAASAATDRATEMPELHKALRMELDAGLTADQLSCPGNAPVACPTTLRFTPRGVAVEVAQDGTIFLAPRLMQTHRADAEGNLTLDPNAVMMSPPIPETDKSGAATYGALTTFAPVARTAQNDATPPATQTDAAPAAVPPIPPAAEPQPAAEAPAAPEPEAAPEPAAEAAPAPAAAAGPTSPGPTSLGQTSPGPGSPAAGSGWMWSKAPSPRSAAA